jgi:hypothetical protein
MNNYFFTSVLVILAVIMLSCTPGMNRKSKSEIIFQDDFGTTSQGVLVENVVQLPPPLGLDYKWKVLMNGCLPVNWTMVDEIPFPEPKKGFWVIPADSGYMEQGGRSHNSVLFANVPIPGDVKNFDISFRQKRGDNDYIGYLIGLPEPALQGGIEFGYMTQVPGTDSTTVNIFTKGELRETMIPGLAFARQWAQHLIKVRGDSVSWFIEGTKVASSVVADKSKSGYFGIRHRYERGTQYDDVLIKSVTN